MNAGPAAYEVYAQELYNRAWGYPLWEPEPEARGEVLIGDVGYLRHGAFYRLFNAVTVVDGETQRTGTPNPPSGSARFILDQSLVHSKSNAMSKGPHYSRSVRRIGMGADAGTHGAKFGFECECTSQYGAMVILDTPGIREEHSEAKIAIASDFDLIRVCESRSDEDRPKLIPDDIPRFLEEVQPDIEVTEDGLGLLQFIDDDTAVHIAESAKAGDALPSAPTAGSSNTTSTEPTPHKEAGDDHGGRRGDSAVSGPGASDTSQVDSGAGAIDINSATPPSSRDEDKWKLGDQYHVLPLPPLSSEQRRGGISALAYSPVGREIAAGFEDNTIIVWTAMNRSVRFQFEDHSDTVSSLVFSPDGSKLVSGGRDGRVIIWDLIDGGSIRSLNAHQGAVERVAYSADGKLIASGADSVVKLWEAESGNLRGTTEEHGGIIMYVVFSPDNERFVSTSSDGSARVWSTHTASHVCDLKGHEGVIYTIAYSHDGRRLVTGADDGTARIWSALIGDEFARLSEGEGGSVWAAAFSADGKELHSVGSERVIKTYDSFTAELIDTIDGGDKVAMAPAFSADGRLLAAGGEDHIITVWDMATKQEVVQLPGHTDNVNYLAFSHDNRHITSASDDGTVCKWELPALVTTTA
ncbi:WD40-repeat-containing domain protein [Fomitopsis serialis]|uniref:WD40-repeat-containing domain protein n=1 Tax=Fomitopsis serialis TaxID=139415 RepID=UPI0020079AEB|nr:WD40-repeat-containing domain protein [Neoantrodia serialis]KAH9919629.1 WD40-repeat-containing domain protein [Neoantrodia serialis]